MRIDDPMVFLLILALAFSLGALVLAGNKYRLTGHEYLGRFYSKLRINLLYTALLTVYMLVGADPHRITGRFVDHAFFALISLAAITLIYADSFFQAQACLTLVERTLNRAGKLPLLVLLPASLVLIAGVFVLAGGPERQGYLDPVFYLAVFINSAYTIGSSLSMIVLSRTWIQKRRKAVFFAGALFIFTTASYLLIVACGELGWISKSLFLAQMLAKAIVFNAFILMYLNAFLLAVGEKSEPGARGGWIGDGFLKQYAISRREQEIIQLISEGKSNAEIGRQLFISLPTVKGHVYNIYQKTGVRNRVQLVNLIKACPPSGH